MADAKKTTTYMRLADSVADGSFVDPQTKFELTRANPVEIPESLGATTQALMGKGKIIKCDKDGKPFKRED